MGDEPTPKKKRKRKKINIAPASKSPAVPPPLGKDLEIFGPAQLAFEGARRIAEDPDKTMKTLRLAASFVPGLSGALSLAEQTAKLTGVQLIPDEPERRRAVARAALQRLSLLANMPGMQMVKSVLDLATGGLLSRLQDRELQATMQAVMSGDPERARLIAVGQIAPDKVGYARPCFYPSHAEILTERGRQARSAGSHHLDSTVDAQRKRRSQSGGGGDSYSRTQHRGTEQRTR